MAVERTEVVVVGAGPVGLTLALDLGQRGIRCVLVERNQAASALPKMERCNGRTMEIFPSRPCKRFFTSIRRRFKRFDLAG